MARLPNPGSDNGVWGDVLNEYLSQSLKSDGTLKDNIVTTDAIAPNAIDDTLIADGSISETLLAPAVQTKLNTVSGTPSWSDITNKPAVIAAGATQADARTAIGAGTSNLALGTSSSTAKAGDYQPAAANISDSTATGRALLTASNAAAAKTTLSLTKSDVSLSNVDNTTDLNKPISTATQTALDAKADLVGGLVPTSQIPALALTNVVTVASQAAMLALTSAQVQPGDVAVRSDGAGSFILTSTNPAILANWTLLDAPDDIVTSVNGQQGTVVLGASDVGLGSVNNTSDLNKPISTATQSALDAKADLVGGVVPSSQLPSLSLTTAVTVANQSAMLALTSAQVQPGDLAIRSDGAGTFILTATDPSVLSNWKVLSAPTDTVTSVNSQQGVVVLGKSDVGLGNADNTSDATKNSAVATLTNKTIDAASNTISNLDVADFAASAIVTNAEGIASNNNDTTLPTSAAVKSYVDANSGGNTTTTINAIEETAVGLGAVASIPSATTTATGTARVTYRISIDSVGVRLVYVNYYETGTGHATDANDLVIGGASVWLAGTGYRVTFNGANGVTIKPGGYAITDPILALDLPADTLIDVRTYLSGTWHPNRYANGPGMGGWTATTDLTAPGSGAIADNTSFQYLIGPVAILGNPTTTSVKNVFAVGDSILWGMHDGPSGAAGINSTYDRMGGGGFAARAARTAEFSLMNAAIGGQTAQVFATLIGHHRTMSFAKGYYNAIEEYGRNDLFAGRTLAQLKADVITIWNLLAARGLRTFRTTLVPDTTSTDGWITTTNQTVKAWETDRVNFNDWLRDGAPMSGGAAAAIGAIGAARCNYYNSAGTLVTPASGPSHPLYGVVDTADTVESSRNSGKWVTPYASRTITDAQSSAGGSVVTSPAQASFVIANDIGKVIVFPGAGTAGGLYVGTIKNIFSGTQAGVTPTTATAVASGGTAHILDAATFDGVHPHPSAHAAMAVPIAAIASTEFV